MRQCQRSVVLPIEKFPFLVLGRDTIIMLQHIIIHFSFHYLSSTCSHLQEVKIKENFKLLVVMVAYEMWSLTRGTTVLF